MTMVQPVLEFNWNLLFTAVTVIVLFLILKHFFFEKVHQFMEDRENAVKDSLLHAEEVNRQAEEALVQYQSRLEGAEDECRRLLKAARDEAKNQAREIVDEANEKSRALMDHSQKEIRRERYNARKELQEEVGGLAMLAAEKILERELDPKTHEEIISQIIEEAEEKPWS